MPPVKVDNAPLAEVGALSTLAPIVEKVEPSVVTIATSKNVRPGQNPYFNDPTFRRFFGIPEGEQPDPKAAPNGRKRKQRLGLGSGIVVSAEGHILTNNHVIDGADDIVITLSKDKTEYRAKKIGTDPETDLAVLKIEPMGKLSPVTFADSDKIRVGDLALAVGNPFGLAQSVTMGIVSATGRGGTGITEYDSFIQTDASINPGNSGGALVNDRGELIGINSAILSRTGQSGGIGFAIPVSTMLTVAEQLLDQGFVEYAQLGVTTTPVTPSIAERFDLDVAQGAIVVGTPQGDPDGVADGSAADDIGLREDDIIIAFDGEPITDTAELFAAVRQHRPGDVVEVTWVRDGEEMSAEATLGTAPRRPE